MQRGAESWPYLGLVSASMPLSGSIRTSYIAELLTHLLLTSLSDPPFPPHPPPQLPLLIMPPNLLVVLHQTGRSWWWHIHHLEKSLWVALSDNEVILLLSYLLETFVIFLSNVYILTYMQTLRYRSVQGAKKLFTAWLTAYVISCTDTV